MNRKKRDMNSSKKVAVLLLDGPLGVSELSHRMGKTYPIGTSTFKALLSHGIVMRSKLDGTYRLTQKGMVAASQWSYDLKLNNAHPSQVTTVTKMQPETKVPKPREYGTVRLIETYLKNAERPLRNKDLAEMSGTLRSGVTRALHILEETGSAIRHPDQTWTYAGTRGEPVAQEPESSNLYEVKSDDSEVTEIHLKGQDLKDFIDQVKREGQREYQEELRSYVKEPAEDWQKRHVEFLEEIVRNLTANK